MTPQQAYKKIEDICKHAYEAGVGTPCPWAMALCSCRRQESLSSRPFRCICCGRVIPAHSHKQWLVLRKRLWRGAPILAGVESPATTNFSDSEPYQVAYLD